MEDMIYRRKMVMKMVVSTKDNDAEADDCKDLKHDDHDDGSQADRDVMDAAAAYNRPSSNNCLLLLILILILITIIITIIITISSPFPACLDLRNKVPCFRPKKISAYFISGANCLRQWICIH